MPPEKDEKTEPATDKRREESRENGQVVKSREVTSVAVLVAGVVYFSFFAGQMGTTLMKLTRFFFTEAAIRDDSPENLFRIFLEAAQGVGWAIMPLLLTVVIFSLPVLLVTPVLPARPSGSIPSRVCTLFSFQTEFIRMVRETWLPFAGKYQP